ncbi:MAG: hypothetical protein E5Y00_13310, partial [Mesorhizobium sp.]
MADRDGTFEMGAARSFEGAVERGEAAVPRAPDQHAAATSEALANLRLMVDSMPIGVIVLDAELRAEIINRAFYDFWKIDPLRATAGCGFRELMEASRDADPYGADEVGWQRHIAEREAEIRAGVA